MSITVTISPTTAGPIKQAPMPLASTPRNTQTFTASVANDSYNKGVTWAIAQGGGSIDSLGVFTPPIDFGPGKSTISATSVTDPTKSATAVVTYTDSQA